VSASSASAECGAAKARPAGEFDQTVMSGGIERVYILHVPPGYDGTEPTPLVMLFHGFALAGRSMLDYSELGTVADSEGFLLVAPTGTGDPHRWNSSLAPGGADDVLFVNDLLDKLEAELCVDTDRVFATGYSNGGGMSNKLACDVSDRVKAVGLVAAVFQPCTPKVALIAFHGTIDSLVPIEGRTGTGETGGTPTLRTFTFPSVPSSVTAWASALACDAEPEVTQAGEHVELSTYNGCTPGEEAVQFYVVDGGGHTWPGAELFGDPAETTQEVDASELIWEFFASAP